MAQSGHFDRWDGALTQGNPAPIRRKMFVKASIVPKLSPERLKRESLITHLACSLLKDPMKAVGFLNRNNETLGGRPLEVATKSAAGYAAVEKALRLLTRASTRSDRGGMTMSSRRRAAILPRKSSRCVGTPTTH